MPSTASRSGATPCAAVGLPAELVALLVEHRDEQERERSTAAQIWCESGYAFTTPRGEPVIPNTDYHIGSGSSRTPDSVTAGCTTPGHTAATVLHPRHPGAGGHRPDGLVHDNGDGRRLPAHHGCDPG